jgi:hypothetical protein
MTIQHILVCAPDPAYTHHQALFDIALSFSKSLQSLGHPAEVTIDPSLLTGKTLVFGAHLLPVFQGVIEGGDYIIFNSEQVTDESTWFTEAYLGLLKRYPVWDYSQNNIRELAKLDVSAKYCEIGYNPCMSNIALGKSATILGGLSSPLRVDYAPATQGNPVGVFDVLFYGSVNDRRQYIIDALKAKGLNVVALTGYGAYRDKYIKTAKIVLNMHYYDSAIFEIIRVSHLLANKKCVVSEVGDDRPLEAPYQKGVAFARYDDLVSTCTTLLADEDAREFTALKGYDILKARPQVEILKELL